MSEVKRYTASKNNISRHAKGRAIGTTDFVMVMASDYDAALAREADLRDELHNARLASSDTHGLIEAYEESKKSLQQRLTDAEQLLGDWYAANAAGGILVADEDYHLVTATAEMLEQAIQKEGEGS